VELSGRQRAVANALGILASRAILFAIGILLVPFLIGRLGVEE
jgi:hypothetical protein